MEWAEAWRPVLGYEETYVCSTLGRVKYVPTDHIKKINVATFEKDNRYVEVCLLAGKTHRLHRLIAEVLVAKSRELA